MSNTDPRNTLEYNQKIIVGGGYKYYGNITKKG